MRWGRPKWGGEKIKSLDVLVYMIFFPIKSLATDRKTIILLLLHKDYLFYLGRSVPLKKKLDSVFENNEISDGDRMLRLLDEKTEFIICR